MQRRKPSVWQLPREARQRAFAILPCGAEMLARVDEYLSARPEPLEPEQAITLLRTGLKRAREAGVQDVPSWEMHIDIVEMDTPLVQVFQHAGDPLDEVRDDLCDRARAHHGEVGWDAYFFLREPLYRLRSDYAVANWVVWPLLQLSWRRRSDGIELSPERRRLVSGLDRREAFHLRPALGAQPALSRGPPQCNRGEVGVDAGDETHGRCKLAFLQRRS